MGAAIRILVVEEHEIVRDALRVLLGKTPDIDVVGLAPGVGHAIPLLERHDPDIVLAGLSLGDGSAVEFVRIVRQHPGLRGRVLILTGFSDTFAAAEALAGGVSGYVLKSQSSAELLKAIRVVTGGKSYVAPQVAAKLAASSTGNASIPVKQGLGLGSLSQREQEIFHHTVEGYPAKEIAQRLCISPKTVESHRTHINRKLAVRTTADLVRFAVAHGIAVTRRASAEQSAGSEATRLETLH